MSATGIVSAIIERWNVRDAWCHALAATFALIFLVPPAVMLFDRRQPLELTWAHMKPDVVRNGQTVRITWHAIETRNCDGDLERVVEDSSGKIHRFARESTIYHQTLEKDGRTFQKVFTLPMDMPPGPAIYYTEIRRWCSELMRMVWPLTSRSPSVPFTVLQDEGRIRPRVMPVLAAED